MANVTAPVVASMVRPAGVALNAPATDPLPRVGVSTPVVPAHPVVAA